MKNLRIILILMLSSTASFADNTTDQIQLLNSQLQAQMQTMQADQQKQIQTLSLAV